MTYALAVHKRLDVNPRRSKNCGSLETTSLACLFEKDMCWSNYHMHQLQELFFGHIIVYK